ncbi:MAG: T9SS type A sorting domain-containing protein [Ferruginibacter sp.]
MQKFITLLTCCCIATSCYPQAQINVDSPSIAGAILKIKQNTADILKPALTIYPNPANNKIVLQVKNFEPGMVSVKLMDIKGKLVREDERLLTNGTEEITMFLMLKAGIYFIIVGEPGKSARKKLVML